MSGRSYLRQRVGASDGTAGSYLQRRVEQVLSDTEPQQAYADLRNRVRERLLREGLGELFFQHGDGDAEAVVRDRMAAILEQEEELPLTARPATLLRLVQDLIGYGPIQPLIDDPTVTEVLVNRHDDIWVERHGRLEPVPEVRFNSDRAVRDLAERIAQPLRRQIDESHPVLDARLKDGSRVCASLSPPALHGTVIAIRKFSQAMLDLEGLVGAGTLRREEIAFLDRAVRARANLLVVGGTSTGKTTLLNALSGLIPRSERIITIEDAAELQFQQPHVVRFETRQGNAEGRGNISIRELVRTSLRLRPDRIVVGEVRGAEALDMVQANNTGHDGGFSTLHANSARDGLSRLETMVLMADSGLPLAAVRQQVAAAFDLILACVRLRGGARRVAEVAEVEGVEGGEYRVQPLFRYDPATDRLLATGAAPRRLAQKMLWSDQPCSG